MKPIYEAPSRPRKLWLIPVAIVAVVMFCVAAVVLPIAALRAQASAHRRVRAAEARVAKVEAQIANETAVAEAVAQPDAIEAPAGVADAPKRAQKWEYKLLRVISESGLNSAAKEGWEVDCSYGQNNNSAILRSPLRDAVADAKAATSAAAKAAADAAAAVKAAGEAANDAIEEAAKEAERP